MTCSLHEDKYTFLIISRSVLLRKRKVPDRSFRGNQNMHFISSNTFFENCYVYEIMWKNIVQRGRPQMTTWRMRIACWITKAIHTHTLTMCNTHCFSTAAMVARTRIILTFMPTLSVLLYMSLYYDGCNLKLP